MFKFMTAVNAAECLKPLANEVYSPTRKKENKVKQFINVYST